jgi:hypothetical protein
MTIAPWPVFFVWSGEVMEPSPRFRKRCDEQFTVGQTYRLEVVEERSSASHRHYFAAIHEAWVNLPHEIADRFKNSEHLRKWCLIKCGYADEQNFILASATGAEAFASFIGLREPYAVIDVKGRVVRIYTAKSQSVREMGKAEFEQSKRAVLDQVASMTGVTTTQLEHEAAEERHAP